MGSSPSRLEKTLSGTIPESEKFFGFENFGNTCYCNSVLQALYFCPEFRALIVSHAKESRQPAPSSPDSSSLLFELASLFSQVSSQKKRTGSVAPRKFIATVKRENEMFRGAMHQDAHEFLNFVLNALAENLTGEGNDPAPQAQKEKKEKKKKRNEQEAVAQERPAELHQGQQQQAAGAAAGAAAGSRPASWVHELFEGVLTNETRCLCCDTVTSRHEVHLI